MRLPYVAKVNMVYQRVVYPGSIVMQAWTTRFRSVIDSEKKAKEAIQSDGLLFFLDRIQKLSQKTLGIGKELTQETLTKK
ncbi:hypothetical protein TNCV_608881 [Trichonephila clavipes]|nr:hypothetical protein TNCV_608881 [Trichonephila clavipes]